MAKPIAALWVVLLPLVLIASTVRGVANSLSFYAYGFDRFNVVQATGIERSELLQAGQALIDYFNGPQEPIAVTVQRQGQPFTLFNDREVAHLQDVKGLFQVVYRFQELGLGFLGVTLFVGAFRYRGRFRPMVARWTLRGSVLTWGLVGAAGIAALLDFSILFRRFHLISFSNDLWMLDPQRDYLIRLFPQGFWYEAALLVGALAVGGATLLAIMGALALRRETRENLANGEAQA